MDEVTLCKYETDDPKKPIAWISYIGMMQRGVPSSLVLHQLPTKSTTRKSPGPGPIDMKTWQHYAERYFRGKQVVIHTDSARAYRAPVQGCLQTRVVHQIKKIDGVWTKPVFARTTLLDLPSGQRLAVKAGTQCIDGFWAHLRAHVGKNHHSDENLVAELVRSCQFRWWCSGTDPMAKLGATMPKHLV